MLSSPSLIILLLVYSGVVFAKLLSYKDYPKNIKIYSQKDFNKVEITCPKDHYIQEITWDEYINCPRRQFFLKERMPVHTHDHQHFIDGRLFNCSSNGFATLYRKFDNHDMHLRFFKAVPYKTRKTCSNQKAGLYQCPAETIKCDKCALPMGLLDGRLGWKSPYNRSDYNVFNWSPYICVQEPHGIMPTFEVDLMKATWITGFAIRFLAEERIVALDYKKEEGDEWKHFRTFDLKNDDKTHGRTARKDHFFVYQFSDKHFLARYVRFTIKRDTVYFGGVRCFTPELFGCDHHFVKWEKYIYPRKESKQGKKPKVQRGGKQSKKLTKTPSNILNKKKKENTEKTILPDVEKQIVNNNKEPTQGTTIATLVACYFSAGFIAILGMYIVYKWEYHERKIRPEYLR